jgi:hypothetical protein
MISLASIFRHTPKDVNALFVYNALTGAGRAVSFDALSEGVALLDVSGLVPKMQPIAAYLPGR